jgi:hypothetical protein
MNKGFHGVNTAVAVGKPPHDRMNAISYNLVG